LSKFYTCKQVAERYGVRTDTIWQWIRQNKLKAIKIANRIIRIPEEELIAFEQKGTI